jgi:hypothetical protein
MQGRQQQLQLVKSGLLFWQDQAVMQRVQQQQQ